ncbi:MAG: histidine kinase, partial [Parafilimonas sp.]
MNKQNIFWKYKLDHILFWLFTILFHAYVRRYLIDKTGWQEFTLEVFLRNGLLALIVYINLFIGLPLLQTKKYIKFILLLLALLIFYTSIKNFHDEYLYGYVINDAEKKNFWINTYYNFSNALFYLGFTMALQFSKEWFYQRDHFQKLIIETLNSEIKYLKDQINPHFLFNSLN